MDIRGERVGFVAAACVVVCFAMGFPLAAFAQQGNPYVVGSNYGETIIVGCVNHDGTGNRAWACIEGQPGDDYQLIDLYDCTLDSDVSVLAYGGADIVYVVRNTANRTCGGVTQSWSPLSHGALNRQVYVRGGTGNDLLVGDNSSYTVLWGGDGDDYLVAYGGYSMYGENDDDVLMSYSSSVHDRMFGGSGDDCLDDEGTAGCDNMDCGEGGEVAGDSVVLTSSCVEENWEHTTNYCG